MKIINFIEKIWFAISVRWNPWHVKPAICTQIERELATMTEHEGERLDSCKAEVIEPGILVARVSIGGRMTETRAPISDWAVSETRQSLNYWLLAVAQERYQ